MDAPKPTFKARFDSEVEFLQHNLAEDRPPRLAVRVVLDLAKSTGNIAERLRDAAASVGQQMQAAFERHVANATDEAQAQASQLMYAEIDRLPAARQAELIRKGHSASIVSEAVLSQRRIAPEAQAALVAHCADHPSAMQKLAMRADATLDSLAVLASHEDQRVRLAVAASIGSRMRVDEPDRNDRKAAIFGALIAAYESDYAPHLVPVCQSPDQLQEMFDKTSKAMGVVEVFVDNPHTPESVLLDIAASPTMMLVQLGAATRAREVLHNRQEARASSSYDDLAPS